MTLNCLQFPRRHHFLGGLSLKLSLLELEKPARFARQAFPICQVNLDKGGVIKGGAEGEASAAVVWSGDLDQAKGGSYISAADIRADSQFDRFHSVEIDLVVFNLAGILWGVEIILLAHDFPGSAVVFS